MFINLFESCFYVLNFSLFLFGDCVVLVLIFLCEFFFFELEIMALTMSKNSFMGWECLCISDSIVKRRFGEVE